MKKIYLIGEIGINHNGNVKIAKRIISEAKKRGAVKFQKRNPDISTPNKKYEIRNTPWGNITYLDYKKIEFNEKNFDQINKFCKKLILIVFMLGI